jgi:hypothetical protein
VDGGVETDLDVAEWQIEFYADEYGREPVREWMEDLTKQKRLALETALIIVLAERGLDVMGTEYGKALGQGLYEFRLRWSAAEVRSKAGRVSDDAAAKSEKILLRVFFCTAGQKVILLLNGYDKGQDDSARRQQKEIEVARRLLREFRTRKN